MIHSLQGLPPNFIWGVATAACQIEGAWDQAGKGPSVWDVFSQRSGATFEGHSPARACDHVARLEEDLDLLEALGVQAYRFSVSWPRVLPGGRGQVNETGLAFYERLIHGLLQRNITPYLTLFHWDTPQALENEGGFLHPDSPHWFAEYTQLLARRFGDRVRHWITLNEPHAFIEGGLRHGRHAPGHQLPLSQVLRAAHHALLAHGRAVQVLRAEVQQSFVLAAPVLTSAIPESDREEDIQAAYHWTFAQHGTQLRTSSFWMDPLYLGRYPQAALTQFGSDLPRFPDSDLELIHQPLDAFGCNLYDCPTVRAGKDGQAELVPWPPGAPRTAFQWPVTPTGHFYGPLFAWQRYGLPVLITENGLSNRDWVHREGRVRDPERIDFIQRHLLELARAAQAGVPVLGYFHWSLLDNFEWNHGYRERFGLIYVDYESGERTPKDSFYAYRDWIQAQRA